MPLGELEAALLQLPESVRRDVSGYRAEVDRFLKGELPPVRFRAFRVPMGVYEQRQDGRFMVRVRLGAGLALPAQLRKIAELSATHGNGVLHVTTRQDIQIHEVPAAGTADCQEQLLTVGLSARGGGGNTVRNVSASPRAGVDPEEVFDVRPYAIATAEYLLQFKESYNLPRKYKIAFAGKPSDDAFAAVADLGFFACIRDGRYGFRVYAGGGLGPGPRAGVRIEEWIDAEQAPAVAEAVRRLFDQHGDRTNRHAARLRYVVGRQGETKFLEVYRAERDALRRQGLPGALPRPRAFPPAWRESLLAEARELPPASRSRNVLPEKQPGFYSVRLNLALGDIAAADLVEVASLAEIHGEGLVRTSQQQDLLLCGVPGARVEAVLARLRALRTDVLGDQRPSIVACTGASTCKLGLCLSRNLALAIAGRLQTAGLTGNGPLPPVRISGCPNSCGNHQVSGIGFEGMARRVQGRLMPFYQVLAGGGVAEGGTRIGARLGAVPARAVPDLLAEAQASGQTGPDALRQLVARFATPPDPVPDEYYADWGSSEPFSLAGRGPGECGAGTIDIMRVDLDAARQGLARALADTGPSASQALYDTLLLAARVLLPIYGLEPKTDRETFAAFRERLITPAWVAADTGALLDAALDWRLGDRAALTDLRESVQALVDRVERLFLSLDSGLSFRLPPLSGPPPAPAPNAAPAAAPAPAPRQYDLRGVACPMNFVKAKVALEGVPVGETLDFLLDGGDPVRNVPASFIEQGQDVLGVTAEQSHFRVRVRRAK